jgi:hypothetical protein
VSAERIDIEAISPAGTELLRYRVPTEERVLVGRRTAAGVEVSDRSGSGEGRCYLVDRGFSCPDQLTAFLLDYRREALRLDAPPMSAEAIATVMADSDLPALESLLGVAA